MLENQRVNPVSYTHLDVYKRQAGGIVLLQSFKDYYYGYESIDGKPMPGYVDMMEDLNHKDVYKRQI